MKNPYSPGVPVCGNKFYGRCRLVEKILSGEHRRVTVIGVCGMGKTSLLKQIEYQIEDSSSNIGIYLSLQGVKKNEYLKENFEFTCVSKQELFKKRANVDVENIFNEAEDMLRLLRRIDINLMKSKTHLFLLFDSAEDFANLEAEFLKGLRGFFEMSMHLRLIIAASPGIQRLLEISSDWVTSPFIYGSSINFIEPLDSCEVKALIEQVQGDTRVSASNETISEIRRLSYNQPYIIQVICSNLFDENSGCLEYMSVKDKKLLDMSFGTMSNTIEVSYKILSSTQQKIITHVLENESINSIELHKQINLPCEDDLCKLMQLGYLKESNDQYSISNYFLKRWIRDRTGKDGGKNMIKAIVTNITASVIYDVIKSNFQSNNATDAVRGIQDERHKKIKEQLREFERQQNMETIAAQVWEMARKEWKLAWAMYDVLHHFKEKPDEFQSLIGEKSLGNLEISDTDTEEFISNAIAEIKAAEIQGSDNSVSELRKEILRAIQRDDELEVICDRLVREEGVEDAQYTGLTGSSVRTKTYNLVRKMFDTGNVGRLIHTLKDEYPGYF